MKSNSTKSAHATHKVKGKETKVTPKHKPTPKHILKPDVAHGLRDLFIYELKDLYWAEKALTKALPKMIKNASAELADALTRHLEETIGQVTRLEEVFSMLNEKAVAVKCEAMAGLIKETEELMKETEKGEIRDAAIVLAGQKIEHYEIATYGTLYSYAKTLGEQDIAALLEDTLNEEKEADKKLSEITEFSIKNIEFFNEDSVEVLNNLLEINNDRIEGYNHASKETDESDLKKLFSRFAETSEDFKEVLTAEIQNLGGIPVEGTRTSGKLFRTWMDIKASLTNKDRKGILNSCEFGEDVAVKNYEDALKNNNIESHIYDLINKQYAIIKVDHDKIRNLRDAHEGKHDEIDKVKKKSEKNVIQKQVKENVVEPKPDVTEGLRNLFVKELKIIYWAEKALTKAIPKMIKNVTSEVLSDTLAQHLEITKGQVTRLEEVFSLISEKPVAEKCESMAGLIMEAEEIMKETEKGEVRDAGIILAAQKVEHNEIAAYGTLYKFAKSLEQHEAAVLLEDTLKEEKDADIKLSEIAESSINVQAAKEYVDDSDTMVAVKTKIK
jgi:uncharacterized protein (TIGR02284 family)